MPLYEYGCDNCGHTLEVQQKLADAPLTTCPSCGQSALRKLISATSFVLKGGGWYKDGYGSSKDKPRTENQRTDRLEKAISDDKKKSEGGATKDAAAPASSGSEAGGSAASSPTSGGADTKAAAS
jgi:putative FmdB family regulatory protein